MGDEWKVYPLRRLVIVHREQVNPLDYPQQDFLHFSIPAYDDGQRPVTQKGYEIKSSKFLVPPDSVLLSRINPRFPRVWLPNIDASVPAVASTEFLVCTPKDGIDRRFLFYACLSPQFYKELRGRVTGTSSSHQRVRPEDALSIPVPVPPLPEQRTIAHILGTLDDKIELNRRMNETLEAMAQALFKSWFVDFDPVVVNAIKAGNPIPEKFAKRAAHYRQNPDALRFPEHIPRLFPDHFVDSELGPIPEGWEVKPIGGVVKCVGGGTPSTKKREYWEGGTNPFLTPKDMAALNAPIVLHTERHITDAGVEQISSGKLPVGTVILSSRAPIGYMAISKVPLSINQGIIAMVCEGAIPNYYIYFWAKVNMGIIKGKAGGTTFPEISKKAFRTIPMIVPPSDPLKEFERNANSYFELIAGTLEEAKILTTIRDTLLPKLVSGELRVPDVEKIVGDRL